MNMRLRTKVTWIVLLAVSLVVVLGLVAAVVAKPFSLYSTFLDRLGFNLVSFSTNNDGSIDIGGTTTHKIEKSYAISQGQGFSLSIPLGTVSILPTRGKFVGLSADVKVANWSSQTNGTRNQDTAETLGLTQLHDKGSYQVSLVNPHGNLHLKGIPVTLRVPSGIHLTVRDNLGEIRVNGGTYLDLRLHSNLGAIRATASVKDNLILDNNLGSIAFDGKLGSNSSIVNDMGSITVHLTQPQPVQYQLTTNMGSAKVLVPSANVSQEGRSLSGNVPGQGPSRAALTCTSNMGSISLQGE